MSVINSNMLFEFTISNLKVSKESSSKILQNKENLIFLNSSNFDKQYVAMG